MLQRLLDYFISIALGAIIGLCIGSVARYPWGGGLIGAIVGVFLGAAVRAWRGRGIRDEYEDRSLSD